MAGPLRRADIRKSGDNRRRCDVDRRRHHDHRRGDNYADRGADQEAAPSPWAGAPSPTETAPPPGVAPIPPPRVHFHGDAVLLPTPCASAPGRFRQSQISPDRSTRGRVRTCPSRGHPCIVGDSASAWRMKRRAPDITPVSYPNNRPPSAATPTWVILTKVCRVRRDKAALSSGCKARHADGANGTQADIRPSWSTLGKSRR